MLIFFWLQFLLGSWGWRAGAWGENFFLPLSLPSQGSSSLTEPWGSGDFCDSARSSSCVRSLPGKHVAEDGTSVLGPRNSGICFHFHSLPGTRACANSGPHTEAEEETCLALRTGRLYTQDLRIALPATNLSTVALAKPQEWRLDRNVS